MRNALTLLSLAGAALAQGNPVELGAVSWHRDFDAALAEAKDRDKPLLVLFQEVPGWQTCKDFGTHVLSHPMIVEAAETLFVPACVYNNTKGDADEAVLKSFEEPAWNNPVVRILDSDRRDLVPRNGADWTVAGVAGAMVRALEKTEAEVPAWLELLAIESNAHKTGLQTAIFGMAWFWVGEAEFGLLDGVVATRSGFLEGAEVVEVRYDPAVVSYADLAQRAASRECASSAFVLDESQAAAAKRVFGGGVRRAPGPVRPDEEPKYYLLQTPLRHVPMTELQAVRINALVQKGGWERLLSPRQKELLVAVKQDPEAGWPVVVGTEVGAAWRAADEVLRKPGGR